MGCRGSAEDGDSDSADGTPAEEGFSSAESGEQSGTLAEDRHSFSPGFIMMAGGPTTFTHPGASGHSNIDLFGGIGRCLETDTCL